MHEVAPPDCLYREAAVFTQPTPRGERAVFECSHPDNREQHCVLQLVRDDEPFLVCTTCHHCRAPAYLEPVGDMLKEVLAEVEIASASCGKCEEWRKRMNNWGIEGCQQPEHRAAILERLKEAEQELVGNIQNPFWRLMIRGRAVAKVVLSGYFSAAQLLDEALERTKQYKLTHA